MTTEHARESGATMILVAASIFLLIGIAALSVDLSGVRLDRAVDQRVTDAAAAAGSIAVFESDGRIGCEVALDYVRANASEISGIDTDCSAIPITPCGSATPAVEVTKTVDRFSITVVYPVPDAHALMQSGTIGAPTQPVVGDDGEQCERLGVQIASDRTTTFGRVLGSQSETTTVHSVAYAELGANQTTPLNLLLLDRTGCHTMMAAGNGGIIVAAITDPLTGAVYPGQGAADSDGTDCPAIGPDAGVIYKKGNPSTLRADGPPGCPLDLGGGQGCGQLQTLAPTTPGDCLPTGCQSDGPPSVNPVPFPTTMAERLTRAPIDHTFNCVGDYTTAALAADLAWSTDPLTAPDHDIPGCTGGNDHVYDLIRLVGSSGAPTGFQPWSPTYPCTFATPIGAPLAGDWWINCPQLNVLDSVTFTGNVVFDGGVTIEAGSGSLTIDNSGDGQGWAFFRGIDTGSCAPLCGRLRKAGSGTLVLRETAVYSSRSSSIALEGNSSGTLIWTAPTAGPFENLALWADGAGPSSNLDVGCASDPATTVGLHRWAGQSVLTLEGVFFVPWSTVVYCGLGGQEQTSAQFIAQRLRAEGNGILVLEPTIGRSVPFGGAVASTLVR